MPRTTTGCWTCRARKKKCDEAQPVCSSCEFRSITCYGYGAKPQWMDGGTAEREMLAAFIRQCKASYRARRSTMVRPPRPQKSSPSNAPLLKIAPRQDSDASVSSSPGAVFGTHHLSHGSSVSKSPSSTREDRFSYTEREINFVMYYLDHIFPRLCPFFKYAPTDEGRGWLLNLFLRTKPLCSLAVCISACDKAQLMLGPLNESSQPHVDLEMQQVQIVADLRDYLRHLDESDGVDRMSAAVEALACIMHLILFEHWIPRKDEIGHDWIMHLEAASVLLESVALEDCDGNHVEDHFPVQCLTQGEKSAFQYFLTQFSHFYCLTVVSLGFTPALRLSAMRTKAIFTNSELLKNMLGCHDEVMVTMLDIALLRDEKDGAQNISSHEVVQQARTLEARLHTKRATLPSRDYHARMSHGADQTCITNCYISASLVYLAVIRSGFYPNLPDIKSGVFELLDDLEFMRATSLNNIPSWPYCVAGCLSERENYSRVRGLLPCPKEGTHPLVMTKWTLDIIEECWRVRKTLDEGQESCDWVTAMNNLGTRLMLG